MVLVKSSQLMGGKRRCMESMSYTQALHNVMEQ